MRTGKWRSFQSLYCVVLFISVVAYTPAFAEQYPGLRQPPVVVLTEGTSEYVLGKYVEYLEDHTQVLNIQQVSSPEYAAKFTASSEDFLNFGYRNSAFWVRFRVRNEAYASTQWLVELAEPPMNSVTFYAPTGDGDGFVERKTGYVYPFSTREVPVENFVFKMTIEPGTQETYYMRVQDRFISLPLRIWNRDALEQRNQVSKLFTGLAFGALWIMLIYNLFLAATLRDQGYLRYTFFQASLLLYLASVKGYGPHFLWPEQTWFNPFIISLSLELLLLCLLLFAATFLQVEAQAPELGLPYRILLGLLVLSMLTTPFIGSAVLTAVIPLAFMVLVFAALMGAWVLRHGYRPARYYLISWSVFLVIGLVLILERVDFIHFEGMLPDQALEIGAVFMVAFQYLALADRINLYKQERLEAQHALVSQQQVALSLKDELNRSLERSRAELEGKVADRTRDLSDANAKLAMMIAERIHAQEKLEVLASTDPLTGLFNRRYFFLLAEAEFKKAARYNRPLSVIIIDIDHFKKVNDTYGHSAGDQALVHVAHLTRLAARETDVVARHGGDEFVLLLPETDVAAALQAAERLRAQIEHTPIHINGHAITCTITLGVAGSDSGMLDNFDQMLIRADQALYEAKESGRNRVLLYRKPDM